MYIYNIQYDLGMAYVRGGILTELLKQKQFVPMTTAEIIVSLWAGTRGYLDKAWAWCLKPSAPFSFQGGDEGDLEV